MDELRTHSSASASVCFGGYNAHNAEWLGCRMKSNQPSIETITLRPIHRLIQLVPQIGLHW